MTVKIEVWDAITCMCHFHEGRQYPRPTCVKITFEDGEVVQICEHCWNKLDSVVRNRFNDHQKAWDKLLCKLAREADEKTKDTNI